MDQKNCYALCQTVFSSLFLALHTLPDANKARKYWLNPHVKQPTVLGVFIDGLIASDGGKLESDPGP